MCLSTVLTVRGSVSQRGKTSFMLTLGKNVYEANFQQQEMHRMKEAICVTVFRAYIENLLIFTPKLLPPPFFGGKSYCAARTCVAKPHTPRISCRWPRVWKLFHDSSPSSLVLVCGVQQLRGSEPGSYFRSDDSLWWTFFSQPVESLIVQLAAVRALSTCKYTYVL